MEICSVKVNVYLICYFSLVFLLGLTKSITVSVRISSVDSTNDGELPSIVNVTFTIDTNSTVELQMTRVEHIKCNIPIYTVDHGLNGLQIHRENDITNEDVAFYQDRKNEAVIQLSRRNASDGQTDIFISRGEYLYDGVRYSIQPIFRDKREALFDDSQSDLRYAIKPVTPPKANMTDFVKVKDYKFPSAVRNLRSRLLDLPKRRKRQTVSTYYIDVTAFLHRTNYDIFLSRSSYNATQNLANIQEYYAFIFSGVDLIYQNFNSSNFRLRVKLTKLVIFKNSTSLSLTFLPNNESRVDTETVLKNFTTFLTTAVGRDLSFPYDHAMLFVGADLWQDTSDLLGLAWTETLCLDDGYSSSVIEDLGDFTSIITAAHELGHSLSSWHDGENNTCSTEDGYLMAPSEVVFTESIKQNPWRFSNCTVDYFTSFITSLETTGYGEICLSQTLPVVGNFPDVSQRLLGQEIPPDQQCQLKYGSTSYFCEIENYLSLICMQLNCINPMEPDNCYPQPALSGTYCGPGMICHQGVCSNDTIAPITTSTTVSTKSTPPSSTPSTATTSTTSTASTTSATSTASTISAKTSSSIATRSVTPSTSIFTTATVTSLYIFLFASIYLYI